MQRNQTDLPLWCMSYMRKANHTREEMTEKLTIFDISEEDFVNEPLGIIHQWVYESEFEFPDNIRYAITKRGE